MKKVALFTASLLAVATLAFAARINRTTNIMATGATSSPADCKTVVVADAITNEFMITVGSAVVTGVSTTYTNSFSTVYLATPTFVWGVKSGTNDSYHSSLNVTLTTSNMFVTGLATGGVNTVPFILYGTKRSGE